MTEPSQELIDALRREELVAAREMTFEQRVLAGGDLFDEVCERMRDGIRWQFPDADAQRVEEILRQRLAYARRLERGP